MEIEDGGDVDFDLDTLPSTERRLRVYSKKGTGGRLTACDPEQSAAVFFFCPRHLAKFVDAVLSETPKKLQAAAAPSPQFPHMSPDGNPLLGVVAEAAEKPLQEAINTVAVAVSKDLADIPADGSMLSKTDDVLGMALQKQKRT